MEGTFKSKLNKLRSGLNKNSYGKQLLIAIFSSMGIFMNILPLEYKSFLTSNSRVSTFFQDIFYSLSNDRFATFFVACGVFLLIIAKSNCRDISNRLKAVCVIISGAFGLTQILSDPLMSKLDLNILYSSLSVFVRALWKMLALSYLFYCLFIVFLYCIDKITKKCSNPAPEADKKVFLKVFLSCFIVYSVFYIMFYPGIISIDSINQLRQFYKQGPKYMLSLTSWKNSGIDYTITNHHPVFWTMIYGLFSELGNALGDVRIGFAIYNILQMIIVSMTFAYVIYYFYKIGSNRRVLKYCAVFYICFVPFAIWSFTMLKDTTFFILNIFLILCLHKIVATNGMAFKNIRFCLAFFALSLLYMLTRNNGFYFIIVIAIVLLIAFRSYYKQILLTLFTGLILYQGVYINIILPKNNIAPGGKQEMLGIFFQQTANYVRMYPDEVTEDEKAAIEKVLDYDRIAELYYTITQDPVKYTYNQDATFEDLFNYGKVWIKQFFKHPVSYIQATYGTTYNFFRINSESSWSYANAKRQKDMTSEFYHELPQSNLQVTGRNVTHWLLKIGRKIPIINILFSIASFTWAAIACVVVLARRKNKKILIAFLPTMLTMLLFVICPVSNWRYMMPVVSSLPMFILTIFDGKAQQPVLLQAEEIKSTNLNKDKENNNG